MFTKSIPLAVLLCGVATAVGAQKTAKVSVTDAFSAFVLKWIKDPNATCSTFAGAGATPEFCAQLIEKSLLSKKHISRQGGAVGLKEDGEGILGTVRVQCLIEGRPGAFEQTLGESLYLDRQVVVIEQQFTFKPMDRDPWLQLTDIKGADITAEFVGKIAGFSIDLRHKFDDVHLSTAERRSYGIVLLNNLKQIGKLNDSWEVVRKLRPLLSDTNGNRASDLAMLQNLVKELIGLEDPVAADSKIANEILSTK